MSDVNNNPLTAGLNWRQGTCLDSTAFTQYQAVKLTGPNTYVPCTTSDSDSAIAGIVLADRSPGQPRSIPVASLTSDTPIPTLSDGSGIITAGSASLGYLSLSTTVAGRFAPAASGPLRAINSSGAVQDAIVLGAGVVARSTAGALIFDPAKIGAALLPTLLGADFTTGTELVPTSSVTLTGMRFWWYGGAGALVIKCCFWQVGLGLVEAVNVNVNAQGIYTASFTPATLSPATYYWISMYETTGTQIQKSLPAAAPAPPQSFSVELLGYEAAAAAGDAIPSSPSTAFYPITPIYTVP